MSTSSKEATKNSSFCMSDNLEYEKEYNKANVFRPKPKETISLISADFLIKGNDAKKISDKELSELAKKKADDSKFSLRIDSKTDINSQT